MYEYLIKEIVLTSADLKENIFNFQQDKLNFSYSPMADLAMTFDGWEISKILPKGIDTYIAVYKRTGSNRDDLVKAV